MKITKVIILGIDAIEYDLIEEWNLQNLKQTEYGKTVLPLLPAQEPTTVIIWPCFITGKMPHEMGYSTVYVFPQPIQTVFEKVYPFFRKNFIDYAAKDLIQKKHGKQSLINAVSSFLKEIHLTHPPSKTDIRSDTIFDNPNIRSIHLHIPVYDEDGFPVYRKNVVKAVEEKSYRPILEMACTSEFKNRTKEVFGWIEKYNEWDLFMQYFFVLDAVQHVYFANKKKIATFYIMFDEFVGKIKKMLNDETLLLIISDHGQKKGIHTPYGFYSVNKHLGLKNPKITDFRWIIEKILENA